MKKNLKSQITMLMIIGLLIFIVVSLVLYLSKSAIKKQSQQSIKKIQGTAIEMQPIENYVKNCLDKLAKDAIVTLGRQGGYLYKSQGGTLIDYLDTDEGLFFIKHDNSNVAYNIMSPQFPIGVYISSIPDYPWVTFPYKDLRDLDLNKETFEGYFGENTMPPLTSSEGPHSIQIQIEQFIDSNIASCADFSTFKEQGLDIAINASRTSVILGASDVSVKSKIPITITNPNTKESAELSDFSTNVNIRLKDIYFFVKNLVDNDIKDITFNISNANNNKDFMSVRVIKNAYFNDAAKIKSDIVVVTDGKSLVNGKPFDYIFARRNRAPALYYINPNEFSFEHGYSIKRTDIIPDSEPRAEDPDEDDYKINIFIGKSDTPANFPEPLYREQIIFRAEANDGMLSDYQRITVNRR